MPPNPDNTSKSPISVISDANRVKDERFRAAEQLPRNRSLVVSEDKISDENSDTDSAEAEDSSNLPKDEKRIDSVMSRWKKLRENSLSLPTTFLLGFLVASCIERSVGDDGATAEAKAEAKCGFNEIDRALIMNLYQNRLDYRRPHCHKH